MQEYYCGDLYKPYSLHVFTLAPPLFAGHRYSTSGAYFVPLLVHLSAGYSNHRAGNCSCMLLSVHDLPLGSSGRLYLQFKRVVYITVVFSAYNYTNSETIHVILCQNRKS